MEIAKKQKLEEIRQSLLKEKQLLFSNPKTNQSNPSRSSRNKSLSSGDKRLIKTVKVTDSILKQTSSSAQKKRKKFTEIQNHNRIMITFDNNQRHYYVPNAQGLTERNEFLHQVTYGKDNEVMSTHRPHINPISRELAKSRNTDYSTNIEEYSTTDEELLKHIGNELEVFIKQIDKKKRARLLYNEFCVLLKRLRGAVDKSGIVNKLWKYMRPVNNMVDNANVYDILMILLSTCSQPHETTYSLLYEYLSKSGFSIKGTY